MVIPFLSVFCLGISALLSIGVPICLLVFFHRKYGAKVIPALVGAAAFLVFAMGLEQLLHLAVLRPEANGTTWMSNYPIRYMFYGSFAAGVFEETARYLSFLLLRRKYGGIKTALSYGVGHGGIEAILIGGISMAGSLVLILMADAGSEAITQNELLTAQISSMAATPSYLFLVGGAERMMALVIQISLSVIVFYSVYETRKVWLYPVAILLHAAVDAPVALMQAGVMKNVFALEGMVLVSAVLIAMLAAFVHRRLMPAD